MEFVFVCQTLPSGIGVSSRAEGRKDQEAREGMPLDAVAVGIEQRRIKGLD